MKKIYKFIAYLLSKIFVSMNSLTDFYLVSIFVSRVPFRLGDLIRYYYYRSTLDHVGKNVSFPFGVIFSHKDIKIGNNVRFGPFNTIALVDFEDDIIVGQNVDFLSGSQQHVFKTKEIPIWQQGGEIQKITVFNNVWIGAKCVIMNNINTNTVVGSGSVVVKEFESDVIVAGNPAKIIKEW